MAIALPTGDDPGAPFQLETEGHTGDGKPIPGSKAASKALKAIMDSKTTWSKQHKEQYEAGKFYAGDQWFEPDKAALKEEDRIPVVFNYTAKHIDMVVGSEIHNRQEVRFIPRNTDVQVLPQISALGELETSAHSWVMDLCNGWDEQSLAFGDMLKGGMGFTEVYTDDWIEKDVRILVRRIDPQEMMWDGRARMQNLEDARWIARVKLIPLEEAINLWPDREYELRTMAKEATGLSLDQKPEEIFESTPIMYEEGRITQNPGEVQGRKGMVAVIQYQHWCLEDVYQVKDPETQKDVELTEDQFDKLRKRAGDLKLGDLKETKANRKVYKEQFIAGNQLPLTDDEDLPVQAGGFTFKPMTGKWDEKDRCWRGLIYQMMDPARWANKYLSQTMHIINSNPKGGLLAEADAFKDPPSVERDWARPNAILLVEKGALAEKRIDVRPVTPLPTASFQMWQSSVDAISGVAGINVEMLGASEGDQPAITMRQRQVQGMQINAIYFNALTRFRRNQARTVLEFIREFIADGRLIRIGGPFNGQQLPLLREKISPEYDVVIDEAIRSPNAKAEVWAGLQPIMPVVIRSGLMIPELVDLVPGMPASLAAKIKEKMQANGAEPTQRRGQGTQGKGQDPQETEAKVAKLQEEVNLLKAKQQEVLARARALDSQSQVKQFVAHHEVNAKQAKAATDHSVARAKLAREYEQGQLKQMQTMTKMARDSFRSPRVRTMPSANTESGGSI